MSTSQCVYDAIMRSAKELGLEKHDTESTHRGGAIDRLWPPTLPQCAGNTIAYMRFMPRSPQTALRVFLGFRAYSICVDPKWTAPNVRIGVAFSKSNAPESYVFMGPGDVIEMPSGIEEFYIYNGDRFDILLNPNRPNNPGIGYLSFLIGRAPGAVPRFYNNTPSPRAMLIQGGFLTAFATAWANDVDLLCFACHNLKGVAIRYTGYTAANLVRSGWYAGAQVIQLQRAGLNAAETFNPALETPESIQLIETTGATASTAHVAIPTIMMYVPLDYNAIAAQLALYGTGFTNYGTGTNVVTKVWAFVYGIPR